ncbi:hypothetical protein KQI84_03890 [bacterium]|nr:hypothetical protein [bacterium]
MAKRLIKIVVGLVIVLIVAAVVVGGILYMKKDSIVRTATERVLEYVLQVDVSIESAEVEPAKGTIQFNNIVIDNPEGYDSDHAMKFGVVRVEADLPSFRTDKPVIHLIQISDSDITMEKKSLKSSNLQDLAENAKRLSSGTEEAPKEEGTEKQMKIEQLIIEGTTISVAMPFLNGQTAEVPVPRIDKKDLGGEKETVNPAEALEIFFAELLGAIRDAGTGILPDEALKDLGNTLNSLGADVGEQFRGLTEGAGSAAEDVEDAAGDAVRNVREGLGGLLGGGDDEDE